MEVIKPLYLYRYINNKNTVLYVGKSLRALQMRLKEHYLYSNELYSVMGRIEYCVVMSEADLDSLELYLINLWKPIYNKKGKKGDPLSYEVTFDFEWKPYQKPIMRSYYENKFAQSCKIASAINILKLIKVFNSVRNMKMQDDIHHILLDYIASKSEIGAYSIFKNNQICLIPRGKVSVIIKGKKYNNCNGIRLKFPTRNVPYTKKYLDGLTAEVSSYLKVFIGDSNHKYYNPSINIYVEDLNSFMSNYDGIGDIERFARRVYSDATDNETVTHVCTYTSKGCICIWESPFPNNVEKDFQFALRINFELIIKNYRKAC